MDKWPQIAHGGAQYQLQQQLEAEDSHQSILQRFSSSCYCILRWCWYVLIGAQRVIRMFFLNGILILVIIDLTIVNEADDDFLSPKAIYWLLEVFNDEFECRNISIRFQRLWLLVVLQESPCVFCWQLETSDVNVKIGFGDGVVISQVHIFGEFYCYNIFLIYFQDLEGLLNNILAFCSPIVIANVPFFQCAFLTAAI